LHGHNYKIEVELQSQTLDSHGFVCDYLDLVILKNYIDDNLDHRHLNDVLGNDNVTAEKIAKHLYDFCKKHWEQTSAIRVYETDKTCAEYRK
jgi:6-pyruvoyltetrahydropterin/6-carboxytetrahydropterin synthase